MMDNRTWRQALAGAFFIGAGMLLLGSQAGWWSLGALARWWPVGLIAVGIQRGFQRREGLLWIGWGVLLLLWSTQVLVWARTWPLVLVLYGVVLLICPSGHCRVRRDGSRVG